MRRLEDLDRCRIDFESIVNWKTSMLYKVNRVNS